MNDVTLIDLECGNIASVEFALDRLGIDHDRTQSSQGIEAARKLILPGVGAAGFAMCQMQNLGLVEVIRSASQPLLGICLGMQLLFEASEEGNTDCLGLIRGNVTKLKSSDELPVPHMGWSTLSTLKAENKLMTKVPDNTFAYFVHSYACPVNECTIASVEYGRPCAAIVQAGNVFGCQFHPERSSEAGAQILKNFMELPC